MIDRVIDDRYNPIISRDNPDTFYYNPDSKFKGLWVLNLIKFILFLLVVVIKSLVGTIRETKDLYT